MITLFNKKQFLNIAKYFPSFLIFIGSLKLIIFYSSFGIKIVDYLEITEVLISFLDEIIFYLFVFFVPLILFYSFWGKSLGVENKDYFEYQSKLTFKKRILQDIKSHYVSILIFTTSLIFLFFNNMIDYKRLFPSICFLVSILIIFIMREIKIVYLKQYDYFIPTTYTNLLLIFFSFSFIVIQNTFQTINDIKEKQKFYGTEIFFENDTIKCDSNVTYIGQTKNYLFLYNIKEKKSIIYPKKKLEKLILVSK